MSTPPRMMVLNYYGHEFFCALPETFEKAVKQVTESLSIPSTHAIRLSLPAGDMHRFGLQQYLSGQSVYISDNDSYYYAIAGKPFVRFDVHAWEKNSAGGGAAAPGKPPGAGPAAPKDTPKEKEKPKDTGPKIAAQKLKARTLAGKEAEVTAAVSGELAKGPPPGRYLGVLSIDSSHNQAFDGSQLGPGEEVTKFVVHNKNTARILFRPRTVRPKIDVISSEERSLEISLSVKGWQVSTVYPQTSLRDDNGGTFMRWFLRVKKGGIVEDLLTSTETNGVFYELVPSEAPKPKKTDPKGPLVPAWPELSPVTGYCMPSAAFVPHIDRVLNTLGLPPDTRTNMITSWLPGISRHKNIAYRILNASQLEASSALYIIPRPDVFLRIFIIFKGVSDSELADWKGRSVAEVEMGYDWIDALGWRQHVGYSDAWKDDKLFRVVEYSSMEVFDTR